jgi:cytochrome-b5 reductase
MLQQSRRYATEQPSGGGSNTLLFGGIAAVLAGGGYYYYNSQTVKDAAHSAEEKAKELAGKGKEKAESLSGGTGAKPAFTGGDQGFISLKLLSSEIINHNTKKLRFALPEEDQVSGLNVASALLTKYKGPEMEKPVMRPYTPVSDEG